MNVARSIAARERKFDRVRAYDIALLRLKCQSKDVFEGVEASTTAADFNPRPPVYACKFSSAPGHEQLIAFANEDGIVAIQDTDAQAESQGPLEGTQTHNNAVFDVAWMPGELKLITASGDRSAALWDLSLDNRLTELESYRGHTHTVKSAVFRHQDKAVFATGSRDGAIMIWDIRANHSGLPKPDNAIFNSHQIRVPKLKSSVVKNSSAKKTYSVMPQSVTALAFQDDYNLLSCSSGDGMIKVWDLRKNYSVHKKEPIAKHIMNYKGKSKLFNGFTSLLIDPSGISLYASCIDGKIYAYNLSSYNPSPVAEYYGHVPENTVLSFYVKACLSPDGEYLASGSNDETAYIWRTKNPGTPFLGLTGHRDEVTCSDWCSVGDPKIVTCSDDCYHRIWRLSPDVDNEEEQNVFGYAELYQMNTPPVITSPNHQSVYSSSHSRVSTPQSTTSTARSIIGTPQSFASSSETSSVERPALSPIKENIESPSSSLSKRSSVDSRAARKLQFSPSKNQQRAELMSPSKRPERTLTVFSPTTGLPNFVIDGTAPHLHNSPQKSKENVDWLTKLRKRKRAESCDSPPSNSKTKRTPSSRSNSASRPSKRPATGDLRKTPKSSRCLMPAITNFYSNLDIESERV